MMSQGRMLLGVAPENGPDYPGADCRTSGIDCADGIAAGQQCRRHGNGHGQHAGKHLFWPFAERYALGINVNQFV
jgi:hypothetical protein